MKAEACSPQQNQLKFFWFLKWGFTHNMCLNYKHIYIYYEPEPESPNSFKTYLKGKKQIKCECE